MLHSALCKYVLHLYTIKHECMSHDTLSNIFYDSELDIYMSNALQSEDVFGACTFLQKSSILLQLYEVELTINYKLLCVSFQVFLP